MRYTPLGTLELLGIVFGSNGLFALITYMIQRYDSKKSGIKSLATKIDQLSESMAEMSAINARTHILRFSDELQDGVRHSQMYFRQVMEDIDTYNKFCEGHQSFRNSYTMASQQYIRDTYQRLLDKGEFKHE